MLPIKVAPQPSPLHSHARTMLSHIPDNLGQMRICRANVLRTRITVTSKRMMQAAFEIIWTLLSPMIHVAAFFTAVVVVLLTAIFHAVRPKRRQIVHSEGTQTPNDDNQPGSGHAELRPPRERSAGTYNIYSSQQMTSRISACT